MNQNTNDQAQDLPWAEEAIVSSANYELAEYKLAVTTTTPGAKTAIDISSLSESLDVDIVKQEVAAELDAAKESIRVDAVNTTAAESPLLVQMLIDRIAEDGKEHPDLLHFLPYLEGQKEWLLGRADYEDGHARALCHFWQLMLADDGTPGTLALRAKIDISEVGNYHNAAFVQWWEENIRPWAITHGAMFSPEVITTDAEKVLIAASEVLVGIVEKVRGATAVTADADDNSVDEVMKGTLVLDASGRPGTLTRLDFTSNGDSSTAPVVLNVSSGSGYVSVDSIGETNVADECYAEVVPSPEMRKAIDTAVGENSLSIGARLTTTTDADGNVRLVDVVGMSVVDAGNGTPAPDGTVHLNYAVENCFAGASNALGVDTASGADSTATVLLEREGCGTLASMAAMLAVTTTFKDIRESQVDAQAGTEVAGGNAVNNNG